MLPLKKHRASTLQTSAYAIFSTSTAVQLTAFFWDSRHHNGDMNQVPYLGPINIRRHRTNLVARAIWRPGLVHPCNRCIPQYLTEYSFKTTKVKVLFYPTLPNFKNKKKKVAFWKVPRPRPFVLLVRATCRWREVWSIGGMTMTGENKFKTTTDLKSVIPRQYHSFNAPYLSSSTRCSYQKDTTDLHCAQTFSSYLIENRLSPSERPTK